MADLAAVAATIQAAQIQANYALWAAVIGGSALVFSIGIAAKNTLKEIKLEKISEAKRLVYIEFVSNFSKYCFEGMQLPSLIVLSDNSSNRDEYMEFQGYYLDFQGSCNSLYLVATSKIRNELYDFQIKLQDFHLEMFNYFFNKKQRPNLNEIHLEFMKFIDLLRSDLGVVSDDDIEDVLLNKLTTRPILST